LSLLKDILLTCEKIIVTDLNRKDKITCIFVTHDVSLKYFAHRVVHMLDGKIAKIETISEQKRLQTETDLRNSLKQHMDTTVEEHTEMREPGKFYSYHQWLEKHPNTQVKLKTDETSPKIMTENQMVEEPNGNRTGLISVNLGEDNNITVQSK